MWTACYAALKKFWRDWFFRSALFAFLGFSILGCQSASAYYGWIDPLQNNQNYNYRYYTDPNRAWDGYQGYAPYGDANVYDYTTRQRHSFNVVSQRGNQYELYNTRTRRTHWVEIRR